MMVNKLTLDLIKEFEGFRAKAYRDVAGVWTIGYGTTAGAGVGIKPKAGMVITEAEAEKYLKQTVENFAIDITARLTRPANDNQYGAMVSLAYNIGLAAFAKSSVLRLFNAGDTKGAADAFLLWNKATVNGQKRTLPGLARRREAERALFLAPVGTGASPDVEPPKHDPEAFGVAWLIKAIIEGLTLLIMGRK